MDDLDVSLVSDELYVDPGTGEVLPDDVDDPDAGEVLPDDVDDEADAPALFYPDLNAFVSDFIACIYERPLPNSRRTWCPKWWRHDEAVYRLQALWMSWEHMRVNDGPVGAATWLVNYADPIMSVLLDVEGAFKGCSVETGHRDARPHEDARLPCDAPPEGLFTPRR
jgi:hypothetical protein